MKVYIVEDRTITKYKRAGRLVQPQAKMFFTLERRSLPLMDEGYLTSRG